MPDEIMTKLNAIQAKYADKLMSYPNVVGTGIGLATVKGEYTDTPAIVVMVVIKLPETQLAPEDILPHDLEGERVDVQQTGTFEAQ